MPGYKTSRTTSTLTISVNILNQSAKLSMSINIFLSICCSRNFIQPVKQNKPDKAGLFCLLPVYYFFQSRFTELAPEELE